MSLALSGGINVWGEFDGSTRNGFIEGLTTFLLQAGMTMETPVKASIAHTYVSNFTNGQFIQINGLVYTFRTLINNALARDILVGANLAASLANLRAAINGAAGAGTTYSTPTLANPIVTAAVTGGDTLTLSSHWDGPVGNGVSTTIGVLVGGGYKLRMTSPQQRTVDAAKIQALVYIYDRQQVDGLGNRLANIQMISAYDSSIVSGEKTMHVKAARRYRVVAAACFAFCYCAGVDLDTAGSVCDFGIPSIPSESLCGGEIPAFATNEIWFICSDAGLSARTTARTSVVTAIRVTSYESTPGEQDSKELTPSVVGYFNSDACWNGVLTLAGSAIGQFRMMSLQPPNEYGFLLSSPTALVSSILWVGEKEMKIEPLLAWGNTNLLAPRIRGQRFDSWIRTKQTTMDETDTFDGQHWLGVTDRYKFGALWFIVPNLTPLQIESLQASYAH